MNKVLTIVIPSYNTESFMDNILGKLSRFSRIDLLDVIVVNDGSSDNTAEVSHKYERECPTSIRVITKKNGGHGSTINTGIKLAKGKYFKVVDADDWLDIVNLDTLVKVLDSETTDLIFTPFWTVDAKTNRKVLKQILPKNLLWNKKYNLNNTSLEQLPSIHCYTIKTDILKDNHIEIDENAYYVDVEYILYPIPFVNTFKYLNIPVYYYQINQTTQSISISSMKKNKDRHEFVLTNINSYISEKIGLVSNTKKQLMINRLSQMIAAQYKIIVLFSVSKETQNELLKFRSKVNDSFSFNIDAINLPIRLLIKSQFKLMWIVHYLAILKMKLVHV